ncbi:MAG TPA: hypothetical protein VFS59_12285 [Gemmatimonadaceae bacterium]|nr:hypothetical protein [Gemmatimonadaceae bacterium]
MPSDFNPFAAGDPPRDEELAALLRRAVGDVPAGVDWDALASRITRALPPRQSLTWWSYTERWSRRIIPIALAAGLVGAVTLWNAADASGFVVAHSAQDVVAEFVRGAPAEDAALTFARTMTADESLVGPEPE